MDSSRPWKFFCKQAGFVENKYWNCVKGFCLFSFSKVIFGFHGFCLKILKIIHSNWLFNYNAEENLVVNNKDNRLFMSRNYRSDSCPLEISCSKTSIFALEASFLGQILVLRTSNFPAGPLSADSSSTETLYCLNRNTENLFSISFRKRSDRKKENKL